MPGRLHRSAFLIASALAVAHSPATSATSPSPVLAPARAALVSIESCLGPGDEAIEQLRQGLLWGWNNPGHEPPQPGHEISPPPPQYLRSLETDARACASATGMQDAAARKKILLSVQNDLVLKAADCRKFGMGRMIAVRVSTLRGAKPENGWAVFYKWICASFPTEEIRTPQLSSPAAVQLPPGEYTFRAERRNSEGKIESARPAKVIVGGLSEITVELVID